MCNVQNLAIVCYSLSVRRVSQVDKNDLKRLSALNEKKIHQQQMEAQVGCVVVRAWNFHYYHTYTLCSKQW